MSTLPLIFRGERIRALVVGGGEIALRKVRSLAEVGAHVTIIAPEVVPELRELANTSRSVRLLERLFCTGDTRLRRRKDPKSTAFNLVIAATDDESTNTAISRECQAEGIPVNVVDVPELCTVYFAAIVEDKPLQLAISTGGEAPFLARHLKDELRSFTDRWAPRVRWGATYREWVRAHIPEFSQREAMYAKFLDLPDSELAAWKPENPPHDLWSSWAAEMNIQPTEPS